MATADSTPTGPYSIPGCTDEKALNYNPDATQDDNTCKYNNETEKKIENSNDCSDIESYYKRIIILILLIFIIVLIYVYYTYVQKPPSKKISEDSFILQFN